MGILHNDQNECFFCSLNLVCIINSYYRWGQVFILDCVATYEPRDERDATSILERVTPRLAHANAAVVLSAVKVHVMYSIDNPK